MPEEQQFVHIGISELSLRCEQKVDNVLAIIRTQVENPISKWWRSTVSGRWSCLGQWLSYFDIRENRKGIDYALFLTHNRPVEVAFALESVNHTAFEPQTKVNEQTVALVALFTKGETLLAVRIVLIDERGFIVGVEDFGVSGLTMTHLAVQDEFAKYAERHIKEFFNEI